MPGGNGLPSPAPLESKQMPFWSCRERLGHHGSFFGSSTGGCSKKNNNPFVPVVKGK